MAHRRGSVSDEGLTFNDLDDESAIALEKIRGTFDVDQAFENSLRTGATIKNEAELFSMATESCMIKAGGGRGAVFSLAKGLNGICFDAVVRSTTVLTEDSLLSAAKLIGNDGAVREVEQHVRGSRLALFTLISDEPLAFKAAHPLFIDYFAACAVRDCSWQVPLLPWQLTGRWGSVLRMGGEMGHLFWHGLLQNTPAPAPEPIALHALHSIRDVLGVDRLTALRAVVGLSTVAASAEQPLVSADWSGLLLDAESMLAVFSVFKRGVHPKLYRLHLHDNPMGAAGVKHLTDALCRGALANVAVLRLSNTQMADEGLRLFADALTRTHGDALAHCTELYLNDNQLGDDGLVALAEALKPNGDRPAGSLPRCEVLTLANNQIGGPGCTALAEACAAGALAQMKRFLLSNNKASGAPVVEAITKARQRAMGTVDGASSGA